MKYPKLHQQTIIPQNLALLHPAKEHISNWVTINIVEPPNKKKCHPNLKEMVQLTIKSYTFSCHFKQVLKLRILFIHCLNRWQVFTLQWTIYAKSSPDKAIYQIIENGLKVERGNPNNINSTECASIFRKKKFIVSHEKILLKTACAKLIPIIKDSTCAEFYLKSQYCRQLKTATQST